MVFKKKFKKLFKYVRSISNITGWVFFNLGKSFFVTNNLQNRILVVYDLTNQPFAIGDFLVTQVASLINCHKYKVELCDIIISYNSKNPSSSDSVFSGLVKKDNVLLHVTSLMSILTVNPNIGSVFLFNSKTQTERYIYNHAGMYKNIYPGLFDYVTGTYFNHLIFNELIYPFYKEKKFIPKLKPTSALDYWSNEFFEKHIGKSFPVTVNIRNNPYWGDARNSKITEWMRFFQYCIDKFPVKFIVICTKNEIPDELRSLSNVIFAKDYYTELDQDLSLISNSKFHMGSNSGPAAMAYFGSKPYFIFGLKVDDNSLPDFLGDNLVEKIGNNKFKFIFANLGQSFTSEVESFELLCQSFLDMFNLVNDSDEMQFLKSDKLKNGSRLSWMR